MLVEIITPDRTVFSGELELLQLPGIDGSFEIMNRHAPMVSILKKGEIRMVNHKKQEETMKINGGVIEVSDNKIKILVE
jgi:F-type H+-transporting ATPase subunit epsilon